MSVPINNVPRRVVYAASGTGPYAFTFEILANTDIAVYKDDTILTLTTDYSVTIAANGTGSITLVTSPVGATQIAIVGNRTIERTTDFVTGGDFFANTVNDELDQQTIFAQQNAEGLARSLQAPQTDPTSIDMTLPRSTVRANKTLAFDANGNPTTGEVIGDNRGTWAASTSYAKRDIVKDSTNQNIYYANTAHTSSGALPISTNADATKWDLLVDAVASGAAQAAAEAAQAAAEDAQSAAETAETNAASSASGASTSASNAATSASNASTSATSAASNASAAGTSASNASTSATNASTSASAAATSASNASSSATAASGSATNAANSASAASTSASSASTSATNAANSATTAGTHSTNAANSATASANSATASANSATAAAASAAAAAASFDAFDDIYLGAKSSDPSVDNDGDALTVGDQYFNSVANELRVWNGSSWQAASTVGGTVNTIAVNTSAALNYGTANGVTYLNGSKVLTSGSALTFDGTNLGIGTSSPTDKLHVSGEPYPNIKIETNSASSGDSTLDLVGYRTTNSPVGYLKFWNNATSPTELARVTSYREGADNTGNLLFYTSSAGSLGERMRIDSAGNIGIGTSSPSTDLDVFGGIRSTASGGYNQITTTSIGDAAFNNNGNNWLTVKNGVPANAMRIDSSGNVGIGTSSPSQLLEVRGAAAKIRITDTDTSGTTGIEFVDSANTVDAEIEVGNSTQYFAVKTAGSEAMRIDGAGNVGIGTSSPASRLHVSNVGAGNDNCFNVSTPANDNVLLGANLVVDAAGNYTKPSTAISGAGILFEGINSADNHGSIQFLSAPDTNTVSATPLERMRIDGAGNVGIGTSPDTSRLHISYQTPTDGIRLTSDSTNLHSAIRFQNPNGSVGYIRTLNSSTQFVTSSDYRLKEDWQLMTGASERVKALNPVNFAWKVDGLRVDGFLAHEVAEVVPEAVSGEKDAVDADGKPEYQGIDQSKLVPLLTAALQEALAQIEEQKTALDVLTARVSALEGN